MNALKIFVSLLAIFLCNNAFAQNEFNITKVVSSSGIEAWFVEDTSLPIVTISFEFKDAGSKSDPFDKGGLSHMASITMDEGAGELDALEFRKALKMSSSELEFSNGRDSFYGNLRVLSENKTSGFALLKNALTNPRFDDSDVDRMRNAAIARIKDSASDPNYLASRLLNDKAFEGSPYSKNSGGTISSLELISSKDLHHFADNKLTRDNLIISVVGDIDKDELALALDDIFGDLPKKSGIAENRNTKLQNAGDLFVYNYDTPQSVIKIALDGVSVKDPNFATWEVLNHILGGGGFGSRLMAEVREKRGLSYGIYSNIVNLKQNDTLRITTSTKNDSVEDVLEIISDTIRSISETQITNEELSMAKSYLIGSKDLSLSSTRAISEYLLYLQSNNLPMDYLEKRRSAINGVTKEDVENLAKNMLKDDNMLTIIVGKPIGLENSAVFVKEINGIE